MECTHYIHRNLKPENILFKDGKIKLASSAVSKLISSEKHLIDPILHSYAGNLKNKESDYYLRLLILFVINYSYLNNFIFLL